MIHADVIYLIEENPEAHGIFEAHQETQRMVYAEIRSVTMSETYRAMENNIRPEYVFVLADYAEYNGEKIAIWNGKRYAIVRTYVANEKIELTVEGATVDA